MSKVIIPKGYKSNLSAYQTQGAIELVKRNFENEISKSLHKSFRTAFRRRQNRS